MGKTDLTDVTCVLPRTHVNISGGQNLTEMMCILMVAQEANSNILDVSNTTPNMCVLCMVHLQTEPLCPFKVSLCVSSLLYRSHPNCPSRSPAHASQ